MDFLWNTYFQCRFDGREKKKYSLSFFYNILIKGSQERILWKDMTFNDGKGYEYQKWYV